MEFKRLVMITKKSIISDYNKGKQIAKYNYTKKRYIECLQVIQFLSHMMYNFNIIYADDELEILLQKVSRKLFPVFESRRNNIVLFYDYWGWETRGLSHIYLKALLKNNFKVLFVTPKKNKDTCNWIYELFAGSNSLMFFLDDMDDLKLSCEQLFEIYNEYQPEFAFYHSTPYDVTGVVFFYAIKSERYIINLTDHAFWLGAKCFDYVFEFRDFGYNISIQARGIHSSKLLMLPYYPVILKNIDSYDISQIKNIGKYFFSGGSLYKKNGSMVFLELVRDILIKYQDVSFVYVGNGDPSFMINYFNKEGVGERFYYYNECRHFFYFYENSLFYLDTYPIGGALMLQYAVVANTIPISLNFSDDKYCTDSELTGIFMNYTGIPKLSYDSIENIKHEIDALIVHEDYRENKKTQLKDLVISESEFTNQLTSAMKNKKTNFSGNIRALDLKSFTDIYMNMENENHQYYIFFAKSKNKDIYMHFPIKSLIGALQFIVRKLFYERSY